MLEQNVLRFQIAVNDVQSKERTETLQNGVGHLADDRWTEAAEMAALQEVIKIDAQKFKGDADVSAEDKVFQHVDDVQFVFTILLWHNMTQT